jgi:long-chain acyl-CoA synthetase
VTVVDRIREQAARAPAHPALLIDDGQGGLRTVTAAELVASFEAHAKRLRADGVRPGDRCGLVARQGRGFVELALGILASDGCLVPIPDDHRGAIFDAFAERAKLHHVVEEEDTGFVLRSRQTAAVDGAGDAAYRALRPAYLRFTSGTTSRRKGVILGHATLLARLAAANRALRIGPEDRVLWLLPMAHHFVVSILLYLRYGAAVLLPASGLARPILELGSRGAATVLYASPNHIRLLASDASSLGLPSLRLAISTADGLRAETARRFAQRFGIPVTQALGIIEVGLPVANLAAAATKPEALGRPLPDYQVWLRREDGRPLAGPTSPERTGEICIRGPGMLDAYLDPWLTAREILTPDGFRTGDQGWFDADGDLFLVGRRANRISMAGMKFFAEEVEEVLDAHPALRASRVFAREHAHLGEIPVAEVVPADPAQPPEPRALTAFCRERLPAYKIPREFRVVAEIARTSSGKLRRAAGETD